MVCGVLYGVDTRPVLDVHQYYVVGFHTLVLVNHFHPVDRGRPIQGSPTDENNMQVNTHAGANLPSANNKHINCVNSPKERIHTLTFGGFKSRKM
jgi:hypothetical protein